MRRILADALSRQGFDVVATAADRDEALAACNEHRPEHDDPQPAHAGPRRPRHPARPARGARARRCRSSWRLGLLPRPAAPARSTRWPRARSACVAKPAMGESMADFTVELAKKVNDAADSGKSAAPSSSARPPRRPRRDRSIAARPPRRGTKKFVMIASSTRGPRPSASWSPKLPVAARDRVGRRPHAGGLHRLARHAPGRVIPLERHRGQARRLRRPHAPPARPRWHAPAHGGRRPRVPLRRRPDGRPAPARTSRSPTSPRSTVPGCCWSC